MRATRVWFFRSSRRSSISSRRRRDFGRSCQSASASRSACCGPCLSRRLSQADSFAWSTSAKSRCQKNFTEPPLGDARSAQAGDVTQALPTKFRRASPAIFPLKRGLPVVETLFCEFFFLGTIQAFQALNIPASRIRATYDDKTDLLSRPQAQGPFRPEDAILKLCLNHRHLT